MRATPGIHFNDLVRTLDLAPGQVQYHLKHLLAAESVVDEQRYGRTHYFSPEVDDWERGALSLIRRETAGDVVAVLHDRGPMPPGELADALDIARSTLEWHLGHLEEEEVVRKERDERNHVTLVLVRPEETAALLRNGPARDRRPDGRPLHPPRGPPARRSRWDTVTALPLSSVARSGARGARAAARGSCRGW